MKIPDERTLDTVTAIEWNMATPEEREEFREKERREGRISFMCLTCGFPTWRGVAACEACRILE